MKSSFILYLLVLTVLLVPTANIAAQSQAGRISFGFDAGLNKYWGEFSDNQFWLWGDIFMRYNFMDELSAYATFSLAQPRWNTGAEAIKHYPSYFDALTGKYQNSSLDISDLNTTRIIAVDITASYNFFPQSTFVPYAFIGLGYMSFEPRAGSSGADGPLPNNSINKYSKSSLTIPFGVGFESYLTDDLCLNGRVTFRLTGTDYLDDLADSDLGQNDFREVVWSSGNDKLLTFGIGLSYYINKPTKQKESLNIEISGLKPGEWEEIGIKTNYVSSFEFKDNLVFAGMNGEGIIVSDNGGTTWKAVNNGLSYKFVECLCVSGGNILAGTWGKGVYLSSDNGSSWRESGLYGRECKDFAVRGNDTWVATEKGIYYSSDNGKTWAGDGLERNHAYSVAVFGNQLFAGTYSQGIFRSGDGGRTWEQVLKSQDNRLSVRDIIQCKGIIYAATDTSGIFISKDDGKTWQQKKNGLATFKESGKDKYSLSRISGLACSGDSIFAATWNHGVFVSVDGGESWNHCGLKKGTINTSLAVNGSTIYAGEYWGNIFRSQSTGSEWKQVMAGININMMNTLLIDGSSIYIGSNKGLLYSGNGGDSWEFIITGNTNYITSNGSTVYVCNNKGLLTGRGNKFEKITADSINIISAALVGGDVFALTGDNGVLRISGNGSPRQVKGNEKDEEMTMLFAEGSTLYGGTLSGMYVVSGNYNDWTRRELNGSDINGMAALDGIIYAGTENGIFYSAVGGVWNRINQGALTPKIKYVNTLLAQYGSLFAGTGNGIFVTDDNAKTWKYLGLEGKNITGLSLQGNILYAVTRHEASPNSLYRVRMK